MNGRDLVGLLCFVIILVLYVYNVCRYLFSLWKASFMIVTHLV